MQGELYYCQVYTHFAFPYTDSLLLEPLYPIPYFIHSIRLCIFTEMTKQILINTRKRKRQIMLNYTASQKLSFVNKNPNKQTNQKNKTKLRQHCLGEIYN